MALPLPSSPLREFRQRAMQAGAVAFLGKPFSDEQLLKNIWSVLEHKKGGTKAIH
jgi:FixJ family two-component response regulator